MDARCRWVCAAAVLVVLGCGEASIGEVPGDSSVPIDATSAPIDATTSSPVDASTRVDATALLDAAAEPPADAGTDATVSSTGARLLYRQDFESDGWQGDFTGRSTWEGHVAVVTHEPHGGRRALRGNHHGSIVDPITGLPGIGNPLLDWRGAGHDIAERTPHQMYFSYWFRHDDYTYGRGSEGKLFYFVNDTGTGGCRLDSYFGSQLHSLDIHIAYNNGCQPNHWAHCTGDRATCDACRAEGTCDNWGYSALWLKHPEVRPGTGRWRHLEYFVDYDERYFTVWVDGHVMTDTDVYPDGRIEYGPERTFHWTGFQLFYASTSDERALADCVDGPTGVCGGWQIDDLEVWDGLPPR